MNHSEISIVFRKGNPEDLPEIMELVQSAVSHMEEQGIRQWDAVYPSVEEFARDIKRGQLFAGILDREIAVIYTLNQQCEEEYRNGKWREPERSFVIMHRLCVKPDFQNRGIAKAAMEDMENRAGRQGIEAVRLDVYSKNPFARRLYQRCGYREVGTAQWRKGMFYLMEKYLSGKGAGQG